MIKYLRTKGRRVAILMLGAQLLQIVSVNRAHALTGGPSQPEVQAFQPAGASNMVDLFSGDFSYNIPLFELPGPNGGYPFNLSYQSGIGMDQEASWVGLGWSMQPGAITRQMRGLPDEFNGDIVKTKMSINPSVTVGVGVGGAIEIFGGAAELGIGISVNQNNYKGFGYAIDASLGFDRTIKGMTAGLELGLTLDPREGVGVNPSLSLEGKTGKLGLGAGYNSKQGLSNVSMSIETNVKHTGKEKETPMGMQKETKTITSSVSSTLSLAHPGYTPQISMPMKGINLSAKIKFGTVWWGFFASPYISGFYSEQWLDKDGKDVPARAFGYMNYQNAGTGDVLDFNREKDGIVTREAPNLAIPSMTYDIYSVTGQGMNMMYRPLRNDAGIVYDQETSSTSNAVGAGIDVGPALTHVGVNLTLNHAKSTSGKWDDDSNGLRSDAAFQAKQSASLYEPWYFKVHGEPTTDNVSTFDALGGDKAVRVKLSGNDASPNADAWLQMNDNDPGHPVPNNAGLNRDRKNRTQVIATITNAELLTASNEEIIPSYNVNYIDNNGTEKPFVRPTDRPSHIAGYTATNADGLRYVYAIPAYNTVQEEVVFTTDKKRADGRVNVLKANQGPSDNDPDSKVSGTDEFFKKTILPAYAHSYLLTSIIGPDYVDVTNNGVTPDDLGYWVKFTYKETSTSESPYKWRNPFSGAHYQEGWETDPRDDKGSYTYGEKEMWYLARAETKSHIAEFTIEQRDDARGVQYRLQDQNLLGASSFALRNIKLYTRAAGASSPIKTTRFEYDYSLCRGVDNNGLQSGKLTLRRVWFEYGSNTRGKFNPYTFSYNNETETTAIKYDINAYDRWGNYKPYPAGDPLFNSDFPYADQDPDKVEARNTNAAAWSLKEITLPSGGTIMVDYESDDYAYVQQKQAMQMVQFVDPYSPLPGTLNDNFVLTDDSDKWVRFKLEKPIPNTGNVNHAAEVRKYLDTKTNQLYFKLRINLRSEGEDFYEYITGYADISTKDADMKLEVAEENGPFVYGMFKVLPEDGDKSPFSLRAWQHIRTNQPDLANSGRKLDRTDNNAKRIEQIKGLAGLGAQIKQMFGGFYTYCRNKHWGRQVDATKSWIRLNCPDKIKYGGGLRVRQVTIKDQWKDDNDGVYGQVYEYTTTEGTNVISSGVAAYEPFIGGDENALHYAKKFTETIPLRSDNNFFFEYPVNESYYPGAQVGYSKVTVMSLPSAKLAGKTVLHADGLFPSGAGVTYGTSGKTENEFYTAKDFPVITDETGKKNKPYKLAVPIPFFGSIATTKLTASQGYSIVTNDMHGKPKKVSNFRQLKDGKFETTAMSWVKYNYRSEERYYDKERVNVLTNVFKDNQDGTVSIPTAAELASGSVSKVSMGQETELFYDMRTFEDISWGGGANLNTDIVYIPIVFGLIPVPIPTTWPTINKSTTALRTAVTNKVIFKSGILESTEAFDGAATIKTQNIKWDKLTGAVILSSANNNFNAQVYDYSRPAYLEYQGMGAACQNIGLTFAMSAVQKQPGKANTYQFYSEQTAQLHPGDEILLYTVDSGWTTPLTRVIYTGNVEDDELFYSAVPLNATDYEAMIIRSGFRNQLNVTAGTITGLKDPSVKGAQITYSKTVTIPN